MVVVKTKTCGDRVLQLKHNFAIVIGLAILSSTAYDIIFCISNTYKNFCFVVNIILAPNSTFTLYSFDSQFEKMPEKTSAYDPACLPDLLPIYYKKLFPYGPYFKWLNYGGGNPAFL